MQRWIRRLPSSIRSSMAPQKQEHGRRKPGYSTFAPALTTQVPVASIKQEPCLGSAFCCSHSKQLSARRQIMSRGGGKLGDADNGGCSSQDTTELITSLGNEKKFYQGTEMPKKKRDKQGIAVAAKTPTDSLVAPPESVLNKDTMDPGASALCAGSLGLFFLYRAGSHSPPPPRIAFPHGRCKLRHSQPGLGGRA